MTHCQIDYTSFLFFNYFPFGHISKSLIKSIAKLVKCGVNSETLDNNYIQIVFLKKRYCLIERPAKIRGVIVYNTIENESFPII